MDYCWTECLGKGIMVDIFIDDQMKWFQSYLVSIYRQNFFTKIDKMKLQKNAQKVQNFCLGRFTCCFSFLTNAIYLSTNTATPPRGDYVQVSGVLQTGRQCSES